MKSDTDELAEVQNSPVDRTIYVDEDNEVPLVWCVITVIAEGDYEQGRSFYRKL